MSQVRMHMLSDTLFVLWQRHMQSACTDIQGGHPLRKSWRGNQGLRTHDGEQWQCVCRSVFLDSVAPNGSLAGREMTNDPQLPQGFYPVDPRFRLLPGRQIQATCDFDSSERDNPTSAGSTHHDEMCNLYLLTSSPLPFFQMCTNGMGHTDRFGVGMLLIQPLLLPCHIRLSRPRLLETHLPHSQL